LKRTTDTLKLMRYYLESLSRPLSPQTAYYAIQSACRPIFTNYNNWSCRHRENESGYAREPRNTFTLFYARQ